MYNYLSFWTLTLLCLIFCLLFHGIGYGLTAIERSRREKKLRASIERDKKEAVEMLNALKHVIESTKKKAEPAPAPEGGGAVS
jgi:hypothetical protein